MLGTGKNVWIIHFQSVQNDSLKHQEISPHFNYETGRKCKYLRAIRPQTIFNGAFSSI
jgi:hypothetical protein